MPWILPVLNQYDHHGYIEPFGGGASILLAKEPGFDVYNDVYGDVVNLFRVIRGRNTFPEFQRLVGLMPYSRENFFEMKNSYRDMEDPIERAAAYFAVARQTFSGVQKADNYRGWKYSRTGNRCRISQSVNSWLNAVDRLPEVHKRLMSVQIEHIDAIDCIQKYAHDGTFGGRRFTTLVYCDPPYPLDTRPGGQQYKHEFTDEQHDEIVRVLLDAPGHKVISTYESPLYQPLLDYGWELIRKDVFCNALSHFHAKKNLSYEQRRRTECLYCSPGRTKTLFD